ncbi:hypothetical protein HPP92_013075 [Vanilla planifolia]|uniref:AAA+ ATPase domain-containing protein n=1 Tax=Vanilla planifolia TaxID=51239 RepID=A0A835QU90_VANPL|nr:hypothetical protein HPP92_013075 [Vanilla planifolia]
MVGCFGRRYRSRDYQNSEGLLFSSLRVPPLSPGRPSSDVSSQSHLTRSACSIECSSSEGFARRFGLAPVFLASRGTLGICRGYQVRLPNNSYRFYSSDNDGSNASEGKHLPVKDSNEFKCEKSPQEDALSGSKYSNDHAWLGEHDQQEWLKIEKLSIDSKKKESPFLTRRQRFKNELLRRVTPWEKITVSWKTFPYHINEHTKMLLVECAASHLRQKKFASAYGARLTSSTGRILLQSMPGTELYRERLVRALARDLQVPLLVVDRNMLASFDFGEEYASESESEDGNIESGEGCTSESEAEEEKATSNEEEWGSSSEAKSGESDDDAVDVHASVEALKKLVPCNLEEFAKSVSEEVESNATAAESDAASEESKRPLRKGDRVKYVGATMQIEAEKEFKLGKTHSSYGSIDTITFLNSRPLLSGQRGEVYEVKENHVAVILDDGDSKTVKEHGDKDNKLSIYWFDIQDIVHDLDTEAEDWYIALEALCETMILPQIRIARLPLPLKQLTEGLRATKPSKGYDISKLFPNSVIVQLPKEEEQLRIFNKQIEEDKKIINSRNNIIELHKVLEEHDLSCMDLLHLKTDGVILTKQKAEKVIGWARNHYLSSVFLPSINNGRLQIPCQSFEVAFSRLMEQESAAKKPSQSIKNLAKDEYESNFVSAVVPSDEIGVRFDDIGALEDVKRSLNELVILPMRRPELFSHGNLLRPCKGILLFGPPGTGKTLLAKALATEAGANFINITGSTLTSKWFGDAEKLTKALFSFASRLAPVIIFVDEVDSLLGARGGAFEHEATRRMRNEFMAAWDGLRSKDSQRILILGATNRPFDLDDAVIRRLPRRIYVDLPNAENRMKILKIFLSHENLDPLFKFDQLANATDGYSGSDLKNLCIAAAYKPVQELLEDEKQKGEKTEMPSLRPLVLDDFIKAKSKVGASVAYDAASMNELRKWNDRYGEGGSRRVSPFGFGN